MTFLSKLVRFSRGPVRLYMKTVSKKVHNEFGQHNASCIVGLVATYIFMQIQRDQVSLQVGLDSRGPFQPLLPSLPTALGYLLFFPINVSSHVVSTRTVGLGELSSTAPWLLPPSAAHCNAFPHCLVFSLYCWGSLQKTSFYVNFFSKNTPKTLISGAAKCHGFVNPDAMQSAGGTQIGKLQKLQECFR